MPSISRSKVVSWRRCRVRTLSSILRWCRFCRRWSAAPSAALALRPSLRNGEGVRTQSGIAVLYVWRRFCACCLGAMYVCVSPP